MLQEFDFDFDLSAVFSFKKVQLLVQTYVQLNTFGNILLKL